MFLVKINNQLDGSRVLEICGQAFTAEADDHSIDRAIELAGCWEPYQVTYARVVHLRNWIMENEEYQVSLVDIYDMVGCKRFVDKVINAAFVDLGGRYREGFLARMRENERIFFEEDFMDTV
ncbi:hypothetical protein [Chitinophaga sp. LS1]|uniref:hypothetical protein n=1 Tax=Chitinophaga sp. LS1 TaxID=3051176 RepID=UPI002AABDEC0|nr:hypothetical protein [Chitinophaga sp. LS1]WPV64847.1 hypothetical protein QQL36_23880 [Chitinophaga sp. LS1]